VINDSSLDRGVAQQLMSLADALIPADDPWPAPTSTAGLCDYFVEAIRVQRDQIELRILATTWAECPVEDPEQAVLAMQRILPSSFALFRQICYTGYYAQAEVVRVIQSELNCDYHSPPQPTGYVMELDERIPAPRIGSYTPTNQVRRVKTEATQ
jgi:hypothetical protein